MAPAIIAARPVGAGPSSPWLPPPIGSGGGKGGAAADGGGGPGGGGGGGGPPMFTGGGTTGGATESTAGWPWKGEPGNIKSKVKKMFYLPQDAANDGFNSFFFCV